jgi:hypothetical protein
VHYNVIGTALETDVHSFLVFYEIEHFQSSFKLSLYKLILSHLSNNFTLPWLW